MEISKQKLTKLIDKLKQAADMVHSSPQDASETIDEVVEDLEVLCE
jgi:hypothetical protein